MLTATRQPWASMHAVNQGHCAPWMHCRNMPRHRLPPGWATRPRKPTSHRLPTAEEKGRRPGAAMLTGKNKKGTKRERKKAQERKEQASVEGDRCVKNVIGALSMPKKHSASFVLVAISFVCVFVETAVDGGRDPRACEHQDRP